MRHPIISVLLCISTFVFASMQEHAQAKASHELLSLAEESVEEPMSLAQRQETFPALAQLPAELGCVFTIGDPHAIAEDFYSRLGEDAGFTPENVYSIKGLSFATTTRGFTQWALFTNGIMSLVSLSPYEQALTEENRQAIATREQAASAGILIPDEPLYITASFESEDSRQLHELMESISHQANSVLELIPLFGIAGHITKSDTQTILSLDLKKARKELEEKSPESELLDCLKRSSQDEMHIVITQSGSQLHLVITPTLEKMKLVSDVKLSLLNSDKIASLRDQIRGLPYALLWVDEEAISEFPPTRPLREGLKEIRTMLQDIAKAAPIEDHAGIYQQASLALNVVEKSLFNLIPDMDYALSCLIWADDALYADIATGVGILHTPGELQQLSLTDDPQTAFYVEGTPFFPREAGMGIVKYTMNVFHVLEGLALSLDAEKLTELMDSWNSLRNEYFPVIVQFATGLRDVNKGMGSAAGMLLTLPDDENKTLDYYAFCSVEKFASLSSGWSQILASLEKLNELKMEGGNLLPLYTASLGSEPNTMHFIRTTEESGFALPTCIDIGANYASMKSSVLTSYANDDRAAARAFNGAVYMLRFQQLAEILKRGDYQPDEGSLLMKLARSRAVLYGVNTQRDNKLHTRLKLSTDSAKSTK